MIYEYIFIIISLFTLNYIFNISNNISHFLIRIFNIGSSVELLNNIEYNPRNNISLENSILKKYLNSTTESTYDCKIIDGIIYINDYNYLYYNNKSFESCYNIAFESNINNNISFLYYYAGDTNGFVINLSTKITSILQPNSWYKLTYDPFIQMFNIIKML